jgi:hypothetical protein
LVGVISSTFQFIDVEAIGLMARSVPVNVAWSQNGSRVSILIKPSERWNTDLWNQVAQSIHGLSLPYLRRHGKDTRQIARAMNDALRGSIVYSDSPDRDMVWVDMIFEDAGRTREFEILSVGPLLGSLGVTGPVAYAAFEVARETHPPSGLADNGVAHLQAVCDYLEKKGAISL